MNGNWTLFTNAASGGGGGSTDYVKDAFSDISLPPTNNSGLSSTVSKNPIGEFFANTDAPTYGIKTLWIKDLVLLQDRTKWVNNKPTYRVVFNEEFPAAYAYVSGNVRLRNRLQGVSVDLRSIDDIFGVTGVIRRVLWLLNPSEDTGTADIIIDGSDTTRDVTFGPASVDSGQQGYNLYNAQVSGTSNEDHELHDYRIQANENKTLNVAGIELYYELGSSIEAAPGVTYVDKTKSETTAGATLAAPSISGRNGAITTIYKLGSPPGVTLLTVENQSVATVGVGSSGQNTIDVTTGHGASFPVGSGIAVIGSSHYLGRVTNVSTDTLTVFPTLAFGLSNVLYKTWHAGATLQISPTLYSLAYSFDPGIASVNANLSGFGASTSGDFLYTDPYKRYRAWGDNLQWTSLDGQNGIQWQGASGFLQFAGFFQGAEIEYSKNPGQTGLLDCNIGINGIANAIVLAEGVSGTVKKTVFTEAGPGWNQFTINVGATQTGVLISKVNFYEAREPVGVTCGHLAHFKNLANEVMRGAVNSTMAHLGVFQRVYADEFYLNGAWTRGTTHTSAGGVFYEGASTNSILRFQYYGSKFGIVGGEGTSLELLVDGGAIGSTFNVMHSLALGFHTVVMTNKSGTTRVEALDFIRATGEMTSDQEFLPREELSEIPTVYSQSDTPRAPKQGDIWERNTYTNDVWIYLFKRWNKLYVQMSIDDPNVSVFVRTHGTSDGASSGAVADTEHFNFATWSTGAAGSAGRALIGNDASYAGGMNVVDGVSTAGAAAVYHQRYNLVTFTSQTTNGTNHRRSAGHGEFFNEFFTNKGSDASNNAAQSSYAWNGSAWATRNNWVSTGGAVGQFVSGSLMRVLGSTTTHETKTSADVVGSDTAVPASSSCIGGANAANGAGVLTRVAAGAATTASYAWTGSWSASITSTYSLYADTCGGVGFFAGGNLTYNNGGQTAVSSGTVNNSERFNGTSYVADVASSTSRGSPAGGVI